MKSIHNLNDSVKFLTIVLVLIFSSSLSYSQCLSKELVSVELNNDELTIDLRNYSGDLKSYKLRIYNYERADDFISVNLFNTNSIDVEFNNNENVIIIKNISEGDYLIIFENSACDNIYVGEGFSGFPNSGIRIE